MGKFDHYFLMEKDEDVIEYFIEKMPDYFASDAILTCKEIGDGNLNYVFRILDEKTGKSIIIKHSGVETRARSGRILDIDRNRIEAEILLLEEKLAPGYVPHIYLHDSVMCCTIMEDLKAYTIMRTSLLNYEVYPQFADWITTFMAEILLPTSDVAMDHKEKKAIVKKYINPDLCQITEQLVYSDSVGNFPGKNYVPEKISDFIDKEIYQDMKLRLEAAKMKFDFMEHAQVLLHGDLHSGSIFIKKDGIKVFDPEFAFYGPSGYDLGNVIAHLIFALAHSQAENKDDESRATFYEWIITSVCDVVDLFKQKFVSVYDKCVTDCMAKTEGFREYYLDELLSSAAGVAGLELIRRITGVAKVKDITSITDTDKQAAAEKALVHIAKYFIFYRNNMKNGADYVSVVKKYMEVL